MHRWPMDCLRVLVELAVSFISLGAKFFFVFENLFYSLFMRFFIHSLFCFEHWTHEPSSSPFRPQIPNLPRCPRRPGSISPFSLNTTSSGMSCGHGTIANGIGYFRRCRFGADAVCAGAEWLFGGSSFSFGVERWTLMPQGREKRRKGIKEKIEKWLCSCRRRRRRRILQARHRHLLQMRWRLMGNVLERKV